MIKPSSLIIAGSDSGAGAGLQADLKTFSAHKVYAATVVTAITAQNTLGVDKVMNIPANISAHLAAVLPNHNMMEVVEGGREKILKSDNFIEDGFIVLGDKPGLGVEIIPEKLEKAIVNFKKVYKV